MKTKPSGSGYRHFVSTLLVLLVACGSGHVVLAHVLESTPSNSLEIAMRLALVATFIISTHSIVVLMLRGRFGR